MVDDFIAAATAVGASVIRIGEPTDALPRLRELAESGPTVASDLPQALRQSLAGLDFVTPEHAERARLGVSIARAGIAATGSVLLALTDPAERAATTLPVRHAVFLCAADLLPDLASLAPLLHELQVNGRSYLSLTTGPSRTADIERVLTIGVHGPKELHIFLLEGRL